MAESQFTPGYNASQMRAGIQNATSMMERAVEMEMRKKLFPLEVAQAGLQAKRMQNTLEAEEAMRPIKMREMVNNAAFAEFQNTKERELYAQGVVAQQALPSVWNSIYEARTIEDLTNLEAQVTQGAGIAVSSPNFKPHFDGVMNAIKSKKAAIKDQQNEKFRENIINPEQPPEIAAFRKTGTFSSDGATYYTDQLNERGMAVVRKARVAVAAATTPQEALQALTVDGFDYLPDDQQQAIEDFATERAQELRLLESGNPKLYWDGNRLRMESESFFPFTAASETSTGQSGQQSDPFSSYVNDATDNALNGL